MIVYTTGYLGEKTNRGDGKAARLAQMVHDLDVVLTDIRILPWSQYAGWRKASLQALLGDRYVHVPELGNTTRRTGLITIADMAAGIKTVLALPKPPLLLCCCWDFDDCHREEVALALLDCAEVEGVQEITHWGPTLCGPPLMRKAPTPSPELPSLA